MPKYDVLSARAAGISDEAIVGELSKGYPNYDTVAARKSGVPDAEIIKELTGVGPPQSTLSIGTRGQTTSFGKAAEALSAPNYMMAQAVGAAIKGENPIAAGKKGITLEEPKTFGDVIFENMPEQFKAENPTAAAAITTTAGLAGDVLLDPLTYIGGIGKAVAKIPGVTKGLSVSKEWIKKAFVGHEIATDAAKLFTKQVGPASERKAVEILNKYETLQQARTGSAVREMADLDKKIVGLAKETGEDITALRTGITDSVEKRLIQENPTVNDIVESLRARNAEQLAKEQALGLKTGEISQDAGSTVDYFAHVLSPEAKKWLEKNGGKEFKGVSRHMTDTHASMLQRKYGGMSTTEVNEMMAKRGIKDFFRVDPARVQAIRDVRHAKSITGAEFYDEMAKEFGVGAEFRGGEIPQDLIDGLVQAKPKRLDGVYFPPEVAAVIDSHYEKFVNPKEVNSVLRVYDQVQNWWKAWTLGIFPAYHTRNAAGNLWNNFLADVNNPLVYKRAADIQRGKAGVLKTSVGDLSYDDVRQLAADRGVFGKGLYGADIPGSVDDAMAQGKWFTVGRDNKLVKTGMKIGNAIEENARLAHFVDKLGKGMDADSAAKSVKKFLFDYGDLTDFERNVMKRIFPFYTWSRKNIPLQLEMYVRNPGKQLIPIKAKHEIERLSEEDNPPPEENVSEFLRGDYAVRVGGRYDETKFPYAPVAGYLPWGDVPRAVNDPGSMASFMVSPIIKEPLQQAANYDMYFRKPIVNKELPQGTILAGDGKEFERFLGVKFTPRTAHVLKNIRLLATINRANPFQVFGEDVNELGTGQKLAQYILGARNYEVDEVDSMVKGLYGEKRKMDDLQKDLYRLGRELGRAKNEKAKRDIQDRIRITTDAVTRIGEEELPKHLNR